MENKVLLTTEIIVLVICIVIGAFWVVYPEKQFEPTYSVFGLVFIAIDIYRRIKLKKNANHSFLEIDSQNTLFCKYMGEGQDSKKGNIAIFFTD